MTLAVLMNQKKLNRWDKKKVEKNMELAAENGLSDQTKDQLRDQLLYYHVESLQEKLKKDLKVRHFQRQAKAVFNIYKGFH